MGKDASLNHAMVKRAENIPCSWTLIRLHQELARSPFIRSHACVRFPISPSFIFCVSPLDDNSHYEYSPLKCCLASSENGNFNFYHPLLLPWMSERHLNERGPSSKINLSYFHHFIPLEFVLFGFRNFGHALFAKSVSLVSLRDICQAISKILKKC